MAPCTTVRAPLGPRHVARRTPEVREVQYLDINLAGLSSCSFLHLGERYQDKTPGF